MDEIKGIHKIVIEDREKIMITGISDVESFDEREIIIYTTEGVLNLFGEDFKINRLNVEAGDIEIAGYITEIKYTGAEKGDGGGFWNKLFR